MEFKESDAENGLRFKNNNNKEENGGEWKCEWKVWFQEKEDIINSCESQRVHLHRAQFSNFFSPPPITHRLFPFSSPTSLFIL